MRLSWGKKHSFDEMCEIEHVTMLFWGQIQLKFNHGSNLWPADHGQYMP